MLSNASSEFIVGWVEGLYHLVNQSSTAPKPNKSHNRWVSLRYQKRDFSV
jgi:hypothetical protein